MSPNRSPKREAQNTEAILGRVGFLVLLATFGMNQATEGAFARYDLGQRLIIATLGGATAGALMHLGHRLAATLGGIITAVSALFVLQGYLLLREDATGVTGRVLIQYLGAVPGLASYALLYSWMVPPPPPSVESLNLPPVDEKRGTRGPCPKCGFRHKYNGTECHHCGYVQPEAKAP
jgi:hypothetical protein